MLREQIQNTDEYQQIAAQEQQQQQQQPRQAGTVGEALGPVLDAEKGDVLFWTQVAQLVVLLLIYREISRRGGI